MPVEKHLLGDEHMARSEKFLRMLKIIDIIQHRPGLNARELAQRCEVTQRTVFRDLQSMAEAGLPITYDPHRRGYRFLNKVFLQPLTFSVEEALGILASARSLGFQSGGPFAVPAETAVGKIMACLPEGMRHLLNNVENQVEIHMHPLVDYQSVAPVFKQLETAILDHKQVKINYHSLSAGRKSTRLVDPYALTFRGRLWYLIGFCHQRKEVRIFRIDRIQSLAVGGQFVLPENFTLQSYLAGAWEIVRGEPVEVIIRFDPDAAKWIREGCFHPSQKLAGLPDGSVMFTVQVAGTEEIERWVLSFGARAEVIHPAFLRQKVKQSADRMSSLYAGE